MNIQKKIITQWSCDGDERRISNFAFLCFEFKKKKVFESRISRIVMGMREKYPTLPYLKNLSQESSL